MSDNSRSISVSHVYQSNLKGIRVLTLSLLASSFSVLLPLQQSVQAATATNLNDTQSVSKDTVFGACVGLNSLAINGDPNIVTIDEPSPAQIATLNADQQDLLSRCADAIEAGGFGVQQDSQTAQTHEDAKVALSQIAPDEIAAQGKTSVRAVNTQQNNVATRIAALQSGLRGFGLNRLSMNPDGSGFAASDMDKLVGGAAGDDDARPRLGAFINGTLSQGDKDATGREAGFDFDRQGVSVGVDYFVTDSAFIGAALGLGQNEIDIDNNGGGLESDTISLSLYGSIFQQENFYINGFLDYTKSDHDSQRNLLYTLNETDGGCCENVLTGNTVTVNQAALGSTDGNQITLALGGGYELRKNQWNYGPTFELTYSKLEIDGFSESMSNPGAPGRGLALSYGDQDIDSLKTDLGFFVSHASSFGWGILSTQARVDWYHEFKDDSEQIAARYIFDPAGTPLNLQTDEVDSDYFGVNLDVSAALSEGKALFVSYGMLLGLKDISYYQLVAGFRTEF